MCVRVFNDSNDIQEKVAKEKQENSREHKLCSSQRKEKQE
jgi:hypothetical protein